MRSEATALQYAANYNLKACILRAKTHGFAGQYAAYCRPKCRVLQNKGLKSMRQNKLKAKAGRFITNRKHEGIRWRDEP